MTLVKVIDVYSDAKMIISDHDKNLGVELIDSALVLTNEDSGSCNVYRNSRIFSRESSSSI